jgi:hypothetical protein
MPAKREWIRVPYSKFINSKDLFGDEISKNPYQDFNDKIIYKNRFNEERIEKYYITILYVKNDEVVIFCLSDRRDRKTGDLFEKYKHSLHIKTNTLPSNSEKKLFSIYNGKIKIPYEYKEFIDRYPEILPPEIIRNNKMSRVDDLNTQLKSAKDEHTKAVKKLSESINPNTGSLSIDVKTFDKYRNNVRNHVNNIVYLEVAKLIEEKKEELTFTDYHLFDFIESTYNAIQIHPNVMKEFRGVLKAKSAGSITYVGKEISVDNSDKVWKVSGRKTKLPNWLREALLVPSIEFKSNGDWQAEINKIFEADSNYKISEIDEKDKARKDLQDEKTELTDGLVKFGATKLTKNKRE